LSEYVSCAHDRLNFAILELRRLFFVEDVVDSAKFGLSLWFLTYVGSWFNAMTLLIVSWVGLFTIPKVREKGRGRKGIIDFPADLLEQSQDVGPHSGPGEGAVGRAEEQGGRLLAQEEDG